LAGSLSTCEFTMLTPYVDSFLLILSQISTLSTITIFGAKLISLYLFPASFRGKVIYKLVICVLNPQLDREEQE
jgi:hypothetical protein